MATPSVSMWAASESSASEPATNAVDRLDDHEADGEAEGHPEPARRCGPRCGAARRRGRARRARRGRAAITRILAAPVDGVGAERP